MSEDVLSNPATLYKLATTTVDNITPSKSLTNPLTLVQIALAVKNVPFEEIVFVQYPVLDRPVRPEQGRARTRPRRRRCGTRSRRTSRSSSPARPARTRVSSSSSPTRARRRPRPDADGRPRRPARRPRPAEEAIELPVVHHRLDRSAGDLLQRQPARTRLVPARDEALSPRAAPRSRVTDSCGRGIRSSQIARDARRRRRRRSS